MATWHVESVLVELTQVRMRDTYLKVSFGFEIWRAADIAAAAGPAAAASAGLQQNLV